jgi:hypothetical protein
MEGGYVEYVERGYVERGVHGTWNTWNVEYVEYVERGVLFLLPEYREREKEAQHLSPLHVLHIPRNRISHP